MRSAPSAPSLSRNLTALGLASATLLSACKPVVDVETRFRDRIRACLNEAEEINPDSEKVCTANKDVYKCVVGAVAESQWSTAPSSEPGHAPYSYSSDGSPLFDTPVFVPFDDLTYRGIQCKVGPLYASQNGSLADCFLQGVTPNSLVHLQVASELNGRGFVTLSHSELPLTNQSYVVAIGLESALDLNTCAGASIRKNGNSSETKGNGSEFGCKIGEPIYCPELPFSGISDTSKTFIDFAKSEL